MNLKLLRKNAGKTQEEMAQFLNTTHRTYGRYEQGQFEPSIETLIKLADYYQVSLDYLVGRQFKNDAGYLTDKEKEVLKYFRAMSEENQKIILGECKGVLLAQM